MRIFVSFSCLYAVVAILTLTANVSGAAEQGTYVVEPRPGAKMEVFFAEPDNASAIVIFMSGAGGRTNVNTKKGKDLGHLTIDHFLAQGIAIALPNFPSDLKDKDKAKRKRGGMKQAYRRSRAHLADVGSVVSWLKKDKLPVWLVGLSSGPVSIVNFASRGDQKVDGIVLLSPVTKQRSKKSRGVLEVPLNKISVPALVVAHENDGCSASTVSGSKTVHEALTSSANAQFKIITGGDSGPGKVCDSRSHHAFWHNEKELVSVIADFIKANKK